MNCDKADLGSHILICDLASGQAGRIEYLNVDAGTKDLRCNTLDKQPVK